MMEFDLFSSVFWIKSRVFHQMIVCFVGLIIIILMSILMKNSCSTLRNLTKWSNYINF